MNTVFNSFYGVDSNTFSHKSVGSTFFTGSMPPSQTTVPNIHEQTRSISKRLKAGKVVASTSEKSMPAVQRLFDACKHAFSTGLPPSQKAIAQVKSILDDMKPSDVGLENLAAASKNGLRSLRNGASFRSPPITYLELYECDSFSMGIFCLPQSASIPLHDHPGMTVLSKILYGSMHVKSYDWVDQNESLTEAFLRPREAYLVEDQILEAPCETEALFPSHGGNIHTFKAITDCAVLDILTPPYDAKKGRHCTYYREVYSPTSSSDSSEQAADDSDRKIAKLIVHSPPSDFAVKRGIYKGPSVLNDGYPTAANVRFQRVQLKENCQASKDSPMKLDLEARKVPT